MAKTRKKMLDIGSASEQVGLNIVEDSGTRQLLRGGKQVIKGAKTLAVPALATNCPILDDSAISKKALTEYTRCIAEEVRETLTVTAQDMANGYISLSRDIPPVEVGSFEILHYEGAAALAAGQDFELVRNADGTFNKLKWQGWPLGYGERVRIGQEMTVKYNSCRPSAYGPVINYANAYLGKNSSNELLLRRLSDGADLTIPKAGLPSVGNGWGFHYANGNALALTKNGDMTLIYEWTGLAWVKRFEYDVGAINFSVNGVQVNINALLANGWAYFENVESGGGELITPQLTTRGENVEFLAVLGRFRGSENFYLNKALHVVIELDASFNVKKTHVCEFKAPYVESDSDGIGMNNIGLPLSFTMRNGRVTPGSYVQTLVDSGGLEVHHACQGSQIYQVGFLKYTHSFYDFVTFAAPYSYIWPWAEGQSLYIDQIEGDLVVVEHPLLKSDGRLDTFSEVKGRLYGNKNSNPYLQSPEWTTSMSSYYQYLQHWGKYIFITYKGTNGVSYPPAPESNIIGLANIEQNKFLDLSYNGIVLNALKNGYNNFCMLDY